MINFQLLKSLTIPYLQKVSAGVEINNETVNATVLSSLLGTKTVKASISLSFDKNNLNETIAKIYDQLGLKDIPISLSLPLNSFDFQLFTIPDIDEDEITESWLEEIISQQIETSNENLLKYDYTIKDDVLSIFVVSLQKSILSDYEQVITILKPINITPAIMGIESILELDSAFTTGSAAVLLASGDNLQFISYDLGSQKVDGIAK